jgi:hypothetical protein
MTAPAFLSFVGKDAPTLCRQIRRSSRNASEFIGHLTDDNGGNNFGQTAFNGDRGLDRTMYPESEVPTEKPRISHEALLELGRAWLDAMGGEFKGDQECGCVPLHYDVRLTAEIHASVTGSSVKATLNLNVPLAFADDGSFSGGATATMQQEGALAECVLKGEGHVDFGAAGRVTETRDTRAMRLSFEQRSGLTHTATVTCADGTVIRGSAPPELQPIPTFDLQGLVGETIDKPFADVPGMTTRMHLEIVKREQ